MTNSTRSAKEIFLSAVEKPTVGERAAVLDEACAGDAELRRDVEELLQAHDKTGNPLERPAVAPTVLTHSIVERPGMMVGPYKLMEQIGEGGFGLVFVAEQQHPMKRKVALKVIKPGMDTRDVVARFEAERQALALMDHPNIARVLDAGATDSGRPYFVMELVRGIPITDYCDTNQLTPRERLELFVAVCHAVQHAHQKGVIHRDIKPSNVLVTLNDGKPVVKVIDFGVAKALNQALTDRTIYTRFAQMVGTPLYMSPEQAEMTSLDIDTRSDIYSLGVLLYELLTGTTPFDRKRLSQAAFDEIRRIIREEEPPKPSTRLSQSGDSLPSIAAQRKTEPARLSKMFHGDLDWITMKALEKDRTRRYETANGFAADVLRHLNDEPVEASPPSTAYRLRKLARKHRAAVISVSSFVAILAAGVVVSSWLAIREQQAKAVAEQNEQLAFDEKERAEEATQKERAVSRELERANIEIADHLGRNLLNTGEAHCREGMIGLGLPHLAKAHAVCAQSASPNQQLRQSLLSLLGAWANPFADQLTNDGPRLLLSSDGSRIITQVDDHTLRLRDALTGRPLGAPMIHNDKLVSVQFIKAATLILSRTTNEVLIWDGQTAAPVVSGIKCSRESHFALSLDGRHLLMVVDQQAQLWDTAAGKRLGSPVAIPEAVYGISICENSAFGIQHYYPEKSAMEYTYLLWDPTMQTLINVKHDPRFANRASVARTAHDFEPVGLGWRAHKCIWNANENSEWLPSNATIANRLSAVVSRSDGTPLLAVATNSTESGPGICVEWDANSGERIGDPRRLKDQTDGAALMLDGRRLVTWNSSLVHIQDTRTGDPIGEPILTSSWDIRGDDGGFYTELVVLTNKNRLLTKAPDRLELRLWDVDTGKLVGEGISNNPRNWSPKFSSNGKRLLTCSLDDRLLVWDTENGMLVKETAVRSGEYAAISFDGARMLVKPGNGQTGQIIDVATGRQVGEAISLSKEFSRAEFSADGKRLITDDHSSQRAPKLWDAETGKPLADLAFAISPNPNRWEIIQEPHFSPDGQFIEAVHPPRTLTVWNAMTGKPVGPPRQELEGQVEELVFNPIAPQIAAQLADGNVRLWDFKTGRQVGPSLHAPRNFQHLFYSKDGKRLATVSEREVRLWDTATGEPVGNSTSLGDGWRFPSYGVTAIFSADGTRFFAAGTSTVRNRSTIRMWDPAHRQPVGEPLTISEHVTQLTFCRNGSRFVVVDDAGTVQLWDATSQTRIGQSIVNDKLDVYASLNADGSRILVATAQQKRDLEYSVNCLAQVWDPATSAPIGAPIAFSGTPISVAISQDGSRVYRIVNESNDEMPMWDAITGKSVAATRPPAAERSGAANPTEDRFVSIHTGYNLRLQPRDAFSGEPVGVFADGGYMGMLYGELRFAVFSPDQTRCLANVDGSITLWDAASGKSLAALGGPELADSHSAVFSPDGRFITGGTKDGVFHSLPTPEPFPDDPEFVALAVAILTGVELDDHQNVTAISPEKQDSNWSRFAVVGKEWLARQSALAAERERNLHRNSADDTEAGERWFSCVYHLSELIKLVPNDASLHARRGRAASKLHSWEPALAGFREALKIDANNAIALNGLAWILASAPEEVLRDGQAAVRHATLACEQANFKNEEFLQTLAAAYAETGDFAKATENQQRAIGLIPTSKQADASARFELYKSKKPFHHEPKP